MLDQPIDRRINLSKSVLARLESGERLSAVLPIVKNLAQLLEDNETVALLNIAIYGLERIPGQPPPFTGAAYNAAGVVWIGLASARDLGDMTVDGILRDGVPTERNMVVSVNVFELEGHEPPPDLGPGTTRELADHLVRLTHEYKDTQDVLELECDILVPAALENQITMHNADQIKAKIIGEAANGPVSSDAHERLLQRGSMVIPDTFLNAGGVTVSYFEWLKNLSHVRFGRMDKRFEESTYTQILELIEGHTGKTIGREVFAKIARGGDEEDLVNSGLEETMINAYNEIREVREEHGNEFGLRTAAFIVAIDKVATSYMELGIFP